MWAPFCSSVLFAHLNLICRLLFNLSSIIVQSPGEDRITRRHLFDPFDNPLNPVMTKSFNINKSIIGNPPIICQLFVAENRRKRYRCISSYSNCYCLRHHYYSMMYMLGCQTDWRWFERKSFLYGRNMAGIGRGFCFFRPPDALLSIRIDIKPCNRNKVRYRSIQTYCLRFHWRRPKGHVRS